MQRKLWGWTRRVAESATLQVDEIWGEAGGASSLHFHRRKVNLFIVHSGRLEIHYADGSFRTLGPEEPPIIVSAMVTHRMVFPVDCHGLEIYVPENLELPLDPVDIVRFDAGRESIAYAKERAPVCLL